MAIAAVWLYHGVWNKLLAPSGRHAEIVASGPAILGIPSRSLLLFIGAIETLLALWVLSGVRSRWCAIVQTLLLAGMNIGGLVWARNEIADPGGMILQNVAFLVLVWIVTDGSSTSHDHD